MSELLEVRIVAAPEVAARAISRLAAVVAVRHTRGPRPSRTSPGLVLYYLTGWLRPTGPAGNARGDLPGLLAEVARLQRQAAGLRAVLESLTACACGADGSLDCPGCEPVPPLVHRALDGTGGRVSAGTPAALDLPCPPVHCPPAHEEQRP
jgi:hypothetical protein